ncbi:unnamed protein product [Closterium sp. NIES-64]|nr:unnamed protein product [Closterium sp. NIES-64]
MRLTSRVNALLIIMLRGSKMLAFISLFLVASCSTRAAVGQNVSVATIHSRSPGDADLLTFQGRPTSRALAGGDASAEGVGGAAPRQAQVAGRAGPASAEVVGSAETEEGGPVAFGGRRISSLTGIATAGSQMKGRSPADGLTPRGVRGTTGAEKGAQTRRRGRGAGKHKPHAKSNKPGSKTGKKTGRKTGRKRAAEDPLFPWVGKPRLLSRFCHPKRLRYRIEQVDILSRGRRLVLQYQAVRRSVQDYARVLPLLQPIGTITLLQTPLVPSLASPVRSLPLRISSSLFPFPPSLSPPIPSLSPSPFPLSPSPHSLPPSLPIPFPSLSPFPPSLQPPIPSLSLSPFPPRLPPHFSPSFSPHSLHLSLPITSLSSSLPPHTLPLSLPFPPALPPHLLSPSPFLQLSLPISSLPPHLLSPSPFLQLSLPISSLPTHLFSPSPFLPLSLPISSLPTHLISSSPFPPALPTHFISPSPFLPLSLPISPHVPVNPGFHNWNFVIFKYCDGAAFAGSRGAVQSRNANSNKPPVYMEGRWNLIGIVEELLAKQRLGQATDVLLTGCSAGGQGVSMVCDGVAKWMAQYGAKTRCLMDAGFFMDIPTVRGGYAFRRRMSQLASTANLAQSSYDVGCAAGACDMCNNMACL